MKLKIVSSKVVASEDFSDSVNKLTEVTRKKALDVIKRAGYKQKTGKQSALFDTSVLKHDNGIEFDGWHGTGKFGSLALIHNLYIGNSPKAGLSLSDYFDYTKQDDTITKKEFFKYKEFCKDFLERLEEYI